MIPQFHTVIPAGGSGTRLWPLSRHESPKFLHDVLGSGRSLLQSTWDRVAPLSAPSNTWVVTGEAHASAVSEQLPDLEAANLVTEPSPRDSAAAIGLAAMLIHDRDPDATMGSFAADHSITNGWEFRSVIEQAAIAAASGDIVTIGVTPTYPATAYGYIRTGDVLKIEGAPTARRAREFVEKPDAQTARRYAYSGRYRWNAGMFIARADALLDQFRRHAPTLFDALRTIADAWCTEQRSAVLADIWPTLEKKAIDYVVAERAAAEGRVIVIPGDFGWDDVGDFDSVAKLRQPVPGEPRSVSAIGGCELVDVESTGIVFCEEPKVVALVGVDDIVVVDTGDALLVTSRAHAQDVKGVVGTLKERGRDDVL